MIEIVILTSGGLCLIASIGTFSSSFFVSNKDPAEQAKTVSKLKTSSLVLFVVSIILFAVYFYLMRDTKLARKLLDALQTGNPEALQTCDTYVSHKDPKIYDQFKQFTKNVKKSPKLSPEEAQYQVLNFCKTTAMSDLGLK